MEMGTVEQSIANHAAQAGAPLPDRIANAPELIDGLGLYLSAFYDLDGERDRSAGLSAIPWSKIKEYAQFYEFDKEQTEDLLFFIRKMDNAHIKRQNSKKDKG